MEHNSEVEQLRAENARLRDALQAYTFTVAHLQRACNPEDWATYGDWAKLARDVRAALAGGVSGEGNP